MVHYIQLDIDTTPRPYLITLHDGTQQQLYGLQVKWGSMEWFTFAFEDQSNNLWSWRLCDAETGIMLCQSPLFPYKAMEDVLKPFVYLALVRVMKKVDFDERRYRKELRRTLEQTRKKTIN